MHLVLESENGERVSVPINPDEFDFTDEDEEEEGEEDSTGMDIDAAFTSPQRCSDGSADLTGGGGGGAAATSREFRDSTPTPIMQTGSGIGVVSGGGAGADAACAGGSGGASKGPEVGVATRMVGAAAMPDGKGLSGKART